MPSTPEGPAPAPVVQKVRVRYAKRGRLRFASHRDVQRALERAIRRAGVPIAFSAGFSPHPRISYAGAAPTGASSEAEYLELGLTAPVDPAWLRAAVSAALPEGIDVLAVVPAPPGALADLLQASIWDVALPGVDAADLEKAVARLLETDEVQVTRLTKNGPRTFDVRAAIVRAEVGPAGAGPGEPAAGRVGIFGQPCAILRLVVRHATPAVRPDDVLAALRQVADLAPPVPPRIHRLAQGLLDEAAGAVADPLATAADAADADVRP